MFQAQLQATGDAEVRNQDFFDVEVIFPWREIHNKYKYT